MEIDVTDEKRVEFYFCDIALLITNMSGIPNAMFEFSRKIFPYNREPIMQVQRV
jgi:hypothetical protein